MRICSRCKIEKPLEEYRFSSYLKKDGTRSRDRWCKSCYVEKAKEYQQKHPEKVKIWGTRKYRKKNYGLSEAQYQKMVSDQNGVCAICFKEETHRGRGGDVTPLAVDHDHSTGKVRGLLCFACNTGIGKLNDDPRLLQNAIVYLMRSTADQEDLNEER